MAAGLVDSEGLVLASDRISTPHSDDAEQVFGDLTRLIDRVRSEGPEPTGICGVGCGGPMLAGGETVSPLNIHAWRGFPLRRRLAAAVGLPVAVDNDAKALALGEGWLGAAQGVDDYLAMVVSTGIGGGIVLGGRLLDGAQGNAGHIGHVVVEPDGRPCACGGRGCLEAEASGPSIEAATGRPPSDAPDPVTPPHRDHGRAGGGIGGQPLGPGAGRGGRLGGPRLRLGILRRRPRGDRDAGPARLLPGHPDHPRRAGGRWPAGRSGGRGSTGRMARVGRTVGPTVSPTGPSSVITRTTGRELVRAVVLQRPDLWWTALGAVRRLAAPGWWRSPPRLPLPDQAALGASVWSPPTGDRMPIRSPAT